MSGQAAGGHAEPGVDHLDLLDRHQAVVVRDSVAGEHLADGGLDHLVLKAPPVGLGLPHVDVAQALGSLEREVDDQPVGRVPEPGADLLVDLLVGRDVLDERVLHDCLPYIRYYVL
jgi:hypothetical protein